MDCSPFEGTETLLQSRDLGQVLRSEVTAAFVAPCRERVPALFGFFRTSVQTAFN